MDLGIQLFKEIVEKNPENNSLNMIIGNFYIAKSDLFNAKMYYKKALENDKNNESLIKIVARLSE
jgi:tetratricopeptide (TPR) repeat protein